MVLLRGPSQKVPAATFDVLACVYSFPLEGRQLIRKLAQVGADMKLMVGADIMGMAGFEVSTYFRKV
jgi:hypothetical protein